FGRPPLRSGYCPDCQQHNIKARPKIPHCKEQGTDLHFPSGFPQAVLTATRVVFLEGELMKLLLLLPCLLLPGLSYGQTAGAVDEKRLPVVIVSASWLRDRRSSDQAVQSVAPAAAPTRADKNFERQKRINDPVGS